MMKKLIQSSAFLFAGLLFFLGAFSVASAATNPLSVQFSSGSGPLFSQTSMLPGDSAPDASFTATNNSSEDEKLYVEFTGRGELAKAIQIEVKGDNFDKKQTLEQWFSEDGTELQSLGGGDSAKYTLSAVMLPASSDDYQNASVKFAVCVGISPDGQGKCAVGGGDVVTPQVKGTSRGGGTFGSSLRPVGPRGPQQPFIFLAPNPQNPQGQNPAGNQLAGANAGNGQNTHLGSGLGPAPTQNGNGNVEGAKNNTGINNAAAAFFGIPDFLQNHLKCIVIFILILVLIWILTLIFDRLRKSHDLASYPRRVNRFLFISALLTIAFLIAVFLPLCAALGFGILAALSVLWTIFLHFRLK